MNSVFKVLGEIAINNQAANKSIDQTNLKAKSLQARMGQAFTKIGKDAIACGKAVAKGLAVVSAAGAAVAGALVKSSVSAYAEFEQLEGGIKKLFGEETAGKVIENARQAYKTAGLSANEYLAQTAKFSATLIKGLGDDTEAAATMTDMAIKDMADNANTFGTDITRIQDAYSGFARQNYSMLDNLSLGYQGSKEEMARLINDSGVMGKNFKVTADNVNDISFAKIIEAIHVIQGNMDMVDTTFNEANDTIQGSFSMWKASWTNLMTGLGDDENIEPLVDAFFEAGNTVLQNLAKVLPKIGNNLKSAMVTAGKHVRTAMEKNIWPSIQKFTTIHFGIELPDWTVVESSLTSWWNDTGKPAMENINSFFNDIGTWISNNKEMITGFLIAVAGALLIINGPIVLLIAALALVAANWRTIKTGINKALEAMDEFFTQTIPEAWKTFITDIKTWIDDNIVEPIQTAIDKIKEFLGLNDSKTVTVTTVYKNIVNDPVGTLQDATNKAGATSTETRFNLLKTAWDTFWGNNKSAGTTLYEEAIGPELPGAASGLRYVPYDNYAVRLHMGETVLPRNEAEEYRSGKNSGTDTSKLEALMQQVLGIMQQVAANTAAGHSIALDSGVLVGQLAPRLDAQLGTLTARKERRG